jgi:hypothetical protein
MLARLESVRRMLQRPLNPAKEERWPGLAKRWAIASRGNAVTEYALIGALVILLTLAGLQLVGGNFNAALARVKGDMESTKKAAALAELMAANAGNSAAAGLSTNDKAILEQSLTSKLQTTGANGSTEVLANQIAAAAAQMLAEGKIDETQYNTLMDLANQGHKMAEIQGMISDAIRFSNGDISAFQSMTFVMDGKTYTARELGQMIGFDGPAPADFASSSVLSMSTGGTTGSAVSSFINLYNQAVASGALSDPMARSTVDSAATQIASLGELTEDITWNVAQNQMPPDNTNITILTSATTTQMDSSKICAAGDFQDDGTMCTP